MKSRYKSVSFPALMLSAVGISAPTALAAPPTNDTFAGATPVTVGFSEVLDTSDATTDADDAQLNVSCGAPATDASVWYVLEGTDAGVAVDVSQSDYSAGVLVAVGTQGDLQTVTCGPGTVAFFAATGTTYYVLAIDDQQDGSRNGGSLNISFNDIPPPPTVEVALNPIGRVNIHTGVASVSGTYTCTNGSFLDMFVDASQRVGRGSVLAQAFLFETDTCDGVPRAWTVELFPQNGRFAGGKTMTLSIGFSCGIFECSEGFVEQTIQLRGGAQAKAVNPRARGAKAR